MQANWIIANGFSFLIPEEIPHVGIFSLVLFYNRIEAQLFLEYNIRASNLKIAYIVLGNFPNKDTISRIRLLFSNACIRTAFGNDMAGVVLTCRIALWAKNKDASFLVSENKVLIIYKSKTLSCPAPLFSLSRFCRISGFRTNIKPLRLPTLSSL